MPDYQKSKIYQIISPSHPEVPPYYGSTTQTLSARMSAHRAHYRADTRENYNAKLILCYEDAIIVLVENYPCANKSELEKREGEIIKANNCCNKSIPLGKLINYQNGKIYKIYSPSHPEIDPYYGSTTQLLHKRFTDHKYERSCASKLIICYEDAIIELVEEVKCNNVEELLAREAWWIINKPCINKRNPVRPEGAKKKYKAELYIKQREKLSEYSKKYYQNNREKRLEYARQQRKHQNKEEIKEYKKEYYQKNKEAINKRHREYDKKYREMQKKLKSTT